MRRVPENSGGGGLARGDRLPVDGEQGVAGADEPVGRVARRARGDVGDEEAAVGGVRDAQGHARHGGGRPAAPSHARCWGILAPSRVCTA